MQSGAHYGGFDNNANAKYHPWLKIELVAFIFLSILAAKTMPSLFKTLEEN